VRTITTAAVTSNIFIFMGTSSVSSRLNHRGLRAFR
jgi:hypothetical protein